MKEFLLTHIHELLTFAAPGKRLKKGQEMRDPGLVQDAWLHIADGKIQGLGRMQEKPVFKQPVQEIDCTGRIVFPGFVDSHTHLVFARTREQEFVDRIQGLSYEEIARNGGGILNSARKLQATSEEELLVGALQRAKEIMQLGTTTVEIKSGYGLTVRDELKMLRVAQRLKKEVPLRIKTTLLGAHALPLEYKTKRQEYIELVCKEMIPQAAAEKLADYVDVFCETGFFTPAETEKILRTGIDHGLKPRVHANELDFSGGVQAGVAVGAVSVDHLECVGEAEIKLLLTSTTLPTILPSTAFFLKIPYAPARQLIDAGLGIALASDYNPGTSPSGNMSFVLSLACTQQKLLPAEALCAATLNGAAALELSHETGSLEVGKRADLIVTQPLPSYNCIPYFFGKPQLEKVMIGGAFIYDSTC